MAKIWDQIQKAQAQTSHGPTPAQKHRGSPMADPGISSVSNAVANDSTSAQMAGVLDQPARTAPTKRGRPRIEEKHLTLKATKPWEPLGMSRRTWERRQKERRNEHQNSD